MRTTSKRIALAVFLILTVLVCGCETQPENKTKPVVGVLIYWRDDVYIGLMTKFLEQALSDQVDVVILDAKNDQLEQNEQIETLLKQKVSALALNIVDPQAVGHAVDSIKKAGVPLIFFNREPDLASLQQYNKACFVGTNAPDAGNMQGDIITTLWKTHPEYDRNQDGHFQYLMIQANLDNPESQARTEFSIKRAHESGISMQQVGETLFCAWDENMAYESMRTLFPRLAEHVEIIISNNDTMALGAIRAINEHGYNLADNATGKFIPVVGVDAIPQAVEAIQKGVMSGTVVQDAEGMGKAIAAMALNAVKGKGFLDGLPYAWDDSGMAVRIPYSRFTGEHPVP